MVPAMAHLIREVMVRIAMVHIQEDMVQIPMAKTMVLTAMDKEDMVLTAMAHIREFMVRIAMVHIQEDMVQIPMTKTMFLTAMET